MTRMLALSLVLALAPLAVACGTTSEAAPAQPAPKPQPASGSGDMRALCVEIMTHNRVCTEAYIPALVDLRAKYDRPPGIAKEVASNRDAVIAQAKQEWAQDSTDAAIAATCDKITSQLTDDDRANADAARSCLAQQDCAAYTACIMPHFEKRFAK